MSWSKTSAKPHPAGFSYETARLLGQEPSVYATNERAGGESKVAEFPDLPSMSVSTASKNFDMSLNFSLVFVRGHELGDRKYEDGTIKGDVWN